MGLVSCGCTWGTGGEDFSNIMRTLNIAICGVEDDKISVFQSVVPHKDFMCLKSGHTVFALGEATSSMIRGIWDDIKQLENYSLLTDNDKSIIQRLQKYKIVYIKVKKWMDFEKKVTYETQKSIQRIRNSEVKIQIIKYIKEYEKEKAMEKYKTLLKNHKNLVLTGAPGTGKTHLAKELAKNIIGTDDESILDNQMAFAQFHPSYDYSDFVEGLRPVQNEDGTIGFELKDGVFKSLCKKALLGTKNGGQDNFEESWEKLVEALENETFIDIKLKTVDSTFTVELNEYGTGLASRTYSSEETKKIGDWISGKSKFFNKDQLYNIYRGLPGVPAGGHDNYRKLIVAHMKEHFGLLDYKEGEKASNEQKFVMIIDEINRAELSKVFGELFYSIDPGYRGIKGKVQLQYSNLYKGESDPFKEGFYVPENVYIIATMNDIDRSIEPFDFAMKRRFAWGEVTAKESQVMLEEYVNEDWYEKAINKMNAVNAVIQNHFTSYSNANESGNDELSSPYDIGAAYFRKLNKDLLNGNFTDLWKYHIEPVIKDYLKGFSDAKSELEKFKNAYENPVSTMKQENEIIENDDI